MVLDKEIWLDNTEYVMKKLAQGFTLIELLIVIAVLGILAVAVLSAINPIEQINRSRDTGSRSDAEQLIGAMDRFYAAQGYAAWKVDAKTPDKTDLVPWVKVSTAQWIVNGQADVLGLLSTGGTSELKSSFVQRITHAGYNDLWVYDRGTQGDTAYVCFLPASGSFQTEAWTRCGGVVAGTGLPPDLRPMAATICVGAAGNNFSCLP